MSHLAITLFGGFQAELDSHPLTTFGTDKNRALLAYLVLESDHPHRREALAALLWPDHPEAVARNSLRQALFHLRRILAQGSETEPYLLITSGQVKFNPASDHWIDIKDLKSRLSVCRSHHPAGLSLCSECVENLQYAIELYQGDLLAGFTFPRCTVFTNWQVFTQETCHIQVMEALSLLSEYFETNLAFDQLIACTRKKIKLEPWRESAHRRQMWALAMNGQREEALQQYETLREVLWREMGIAPVEETRRLHEQISDNRLPRPQPPYGELWGSHTPADRSPAKAGTMPFVVRQPELEQLQRFPRDSMPGQGWVAFVSSEAGSGKPPLPNEFSRQDMRARGEAVQDRTGHWVLGSPLDWEPLPAWVEAIIVERLHHLDRECLILLESASVQGQVFNAGVLAQVLGITEEVINTRLNGPLCKQHRLVKRFNPEVQDRYPLGFYQFRHYLVQKFLYHGLDEVERKRLHRVTAYALERLFTDAYVRPDTALTSAAYLAWHFEQAELIGKAVEYYRKAGEDAYRMSAFQPAMMNLEHGLALLKELPDTPERARLELAYLSVSTERWPLGNA